MHPARPPSIRPSAPARRAFRLSSAACAAALAAFAGGCFYTSQGLSPPTEQIYYPTGLVVSPERNTLYIANSDFDLQYNGGTVQVVDLGSIRKSVGPILSGIRCSQGFAADCQTLDSGLQGGIAACAQSPDPQCGVRAVCNSIPMTDASAGDNGTSCLTASDCASANCASGICQPCHAAADCPGGSVCSPSGSGVCVLDVASNQILEPSTCTPINPLYKRFATIGAFASGAVLAKNPTAGAGARLFVPVRGDPSITWFDVADDRTAAGQAAPFAFNCGQPPPSSGTPGRCGDGHRIGVDPFDNFRDLTIPVEPIGLDVSSDGKYIVSAHQISGSPAIGLSINDWTAGTQPFFAFYLTGAVATGPTEVAAIPPPAIVTASQAMPQSTTPPIAYQPGFVVSYNLTPELDLFRVNDDHESSPPRPYLTRAQQASVSVNASGQDSRGIAIDPSQRQACESSCAGAPTAGGDPCASQPDLTHCLRCCVNTPLQLFIANRSPPTLLIGNVTTTVVDSDVGGIMGSGAFDAINITGTASLSVGPSKVALGKVITPDGSLATRVFAVAFDTRFIYIFDPAAPNELPAQPIKTGRGPHAIAFDACCDAASPGCAAADACGPNEKAHAYLYVGHFADSYLGVVDLDMRRPETFATMFASIGVPLAPRESM